MNRINGSGQECISQAREAAQENTLQLKPLHRKRERLAEESSENEMCSTAVATNHDPHPRATAADHGRPLPANNGQDQDPTIAVVLSTDVSQGFRHQRQREDPTKRATTGPRTTTVGGVAHANSITPVANSGCKEEYATFWNRIVVHLGRGTHTRSASRDAAGQ